MKEYLKSCQTDFWKHVFEKELEYVLRELNGCKNVLSIGCGPAVIERGLQEGGFNVTGLDISREALEGIPDNIRTLIGSAEDLDISNSSFDAVIYIASLQFINDYEKSIQETRRILRPRGKFLAMLLNPESQFFKEKMKQPDSYVTKIKHANLRPIEEIAIKYFEIIGEYFLGIRDRETFPTDDSKLASLYVIKGARK